MVMYRRSRRGLTNLLAVQKRAIAAAEVDELDSRRSERTEIPYWPTRNRGVVKSDGVR